MCHFLKCTYHYLLFIINVVFLGFFVLFKILLPLPLRNAVSFRPVCLWLEILDVDVDDVKRTSVCELQTEIRFSSHQLSFFFLLLLELSKHS